MKRLTLALGFVALTACHERSHGEHAQGAHAAHKEEAPAPTTAATGNPVQQEMKLLTAALEAAVRSVGLGDVRGVEHELHRVHAAKQATEAALRDGRYRTPLNPERLDRFHELDEAFHHQLERLVEVSRSNDVQGTAKALGEILLSCQGCHQEFRR
jgi:hypothetical protein